MPQPPTSKPPTPKAPTLGPHPVPLSPEQKAKELGARLTKVTREAEKGLDTVYSLIGLVQHDSQSRIEDARKEKERLDQEHDEEAPRVRQLARTAKRTKSESDHAAYVQAARKQRLRRERSSFLGELISRYQAGTSGD